MSSAVAATAPVAPAKKKAESNLDPGLADIILRSRLTILDILESRGYDTTAYRNIAPAQILTLAEANSRSLDIFVPKRTEVAEGEIEAPCNRAVVAHFLTSSIKGRLAGSFRQEIYEPMDPTGNNDIKEDDDLIVIMNEPYVDAFDKTSLEMWQQKKVRMVFFHIKSLVVNPARHVLVPPHRKLTVKETTEVMQRLHVTSKLQLPTIKHFDIQSRVLGLIPGDVVEIMRPSPTAGVSGVLRVCTA
jgi:DNA-directed RNA polymerase subunit H (RpoH/RPB5)